MSQYTVVAGDTLFQIAQVHNISLDALIAANPQLNGSTNLKIGQILNLPGSTPSQTYTVTPGDSMFLIAERFGVSLSDLEAANPQITDPSNISVGTVLNIPAGGTIQTPPTTSPGRIHYSGPASNFPSPNQWKSFSNLWAQNLTTFQVNDSFNEISSIQTSIATVANESGVDPRVILCVIMQESSGNVLVQTTLSPGTPPVRNPGLMQSHNGVEFNPSDPNGSIFQMIKDGTEGTPFGDGLQQCISRFGNVYEGPRAYNSESVVEADLSDGRGATPDYVSDVANRLVGAV